MNNIFNEGIESYCYEEDGKQMAEDRHLFRVQLKTNRSFDLDNVVLDREYFADTEYNDLPDDVKEKGKELYKLDEKKLKSLIMRRMCAWVLNNPEEASKVFDLQITRSSLEK